MTIVFVLHIFVCSQRPKTKELPEFLLLFLWFISSFKRNSINNLLADLGFVPLNFSSTVYHCVTELQWPGYNYCKKSNLAADLRPVDLLFSLRKAEFNNTTSTHRKNYKELLLVLQRREKRAKLTKPNGNFFNNDTKLFLLPEKEAKQKKNSIEGKKSVVKSHLIKNI